MKEPCHNTVPTTDLATKRKRRKGGTSFSNSKRKRWRELKKKDITCIEGRGTPSDFSKQCHVDEIGTLNPHLNLHPIEEEMEDTGSRAPSMAESEHRTNSNQSNSREETREYSINMVSLTWMLYVAEILRYSGFQICHLK